MYLKELTLRGFKSFATATTLRFEPGITAVIGPNGSGKSNIVDALSWVMGEQGVKNLRGTSMEDVIFAGTSDRPPLGRAQVTLTIDNADHTLDIDYSEVTISRTLFRNGGSEYAINGSQCRLLDIQELLSDTGLGQQMHVIVGQGRLDTILRADPSGHRAFIEEAAGILKHRKRKERALRKLANTETNLSRLDDLLGEIHRQLGPLGRQARVSRKAEGIQVTVRDAQARLFAEDALITRTRRERTRSQLAAERSAVQEQQRNLAEVKARIGQLEALGARSNPALTAMNQTWHRLAQIEERLRSVASLAQERARSLEGQIVTNFGEDPALLLQRADELQSQEARQRELVDTTRLAFDQATEARARDEQQLASIRQTLAQLRKSEQQRDERMANYRALIAREESAIELADTRAKDFAAQHASLIAQREQTQRQYDEFDHTLQTSFEDDGKAFQLAKTELQHARESLGDVEERLRSVQGKVIALRSKADALQDTLQGRSESSSFHGDETAEVLGGIADFIRIDDGWQEAVSSALGDFANALVVPDRERVIETLSHVAQARLGKVALLTPYQGEGSIDGDGSSGVLHSAASLVRANPKAHDGAAATRVAAAVRLLLADCAVARDREQAERALDDGRWRCSVTPDGDVFNRAGASGGSSLSHSDLSLAARRDAALEQAQTLQDDVESLTREVTERAAYRDEAGHALDAQSRARTERQLKARQLEQSMASAASRLDHLDRQVSGLNDKTVSMQKDGQMHRMKLDDLRHALEQLQQPNAEHADLDELERREHDDERRLTMAREQEIAAKLAWKDADAKRESLARQQGLLRDQAGQAETRRTRISALNERRRSDIAHITRIGEDATAISRFVQRSIAGLTERRETLQRQSSAHEGELKTLRGSRERFEQTLAECQGREHALDVERERQTAASGQLSQRINDALGMNVEDLLAGYGPDVPVPVLDDNGMAVPLDEDGPARRDAPSTDPPATDPPATDAPVSKVERYKTVPYRRSEQQKRLEKAQRDLKALGKINPLATEEFDALQARNQYLNEQREDVSSSRDDLMQLVKDLDATMTQAFSSAFEDTAKAFEQVFATLFPGGTGRLRLEDPDDMLATGVIVEASPAGKRVKQLSLLSGGERSLTALALLFAIFTARPSPFYVMDEVEAALDSVNLSRLLHALEDLRRHAQLIIITHQQRTMAIADALYGITMRADGVTAVMSQRLDRGRGE